MVMMFGDDSNPSSKKNRPKHDNSAPSSQKNRPKHECSWTIIFLIFAYFGIFGISIFFFHFHDSTQSSTEKMTVMAERLFTFTHSNMGPQYHPTKKSMVAAIERPAMFTAEEHQNFSKLLRGTRIHSSFVQIPKWIRSDKLEKTGFIAPKCTQENTFFICEKEEVPSSPEDSSSSSSDVPPALTIIMVFHNHADEVIETLNSAVKFANIEVPQTDILVINDASSQGEDVTEVIKAANSYVHTHRNVAVRVHHNLNQPLGITSCFNLGLKMARGELALLLGIGIRLVPGSIKAMAATFYTHPDVGVVSPLVLGPDLSTVVSAGGFAGNEGRLWPTAEGRAACDTSLEFTLSMLGGNGLMFTDHLINHVRDIDFAPLTVMMASMNAFHTVGLFDEEYSHAGDVYQDADLGFLMYEAGYRVLYNPASVVILEHDHTILKKGPPTQKARNRFIEKWSQVLDLRGSLMERPEKVVNGPHAMTQIHSLSRAIEIPRLYSFRFLIFCLSNEDVKLSGMVTFIQLLIAMRIWVTVVCSEAMPHEYIESLRYVGAEVLLTEVFATYPHSMVISFTAIWSHGLCGRSTTLSRTDSFFCSTRPLRDPHKPTPHLANYSGDGRPIRAGLLYTDDPLFLNFEVIKSKHCQFYREAGLGSFTQIESASKMIPYLIKILDGGMKVSNDMEYRFAAMNNFQKMKN